MKALILAAMISTSGSVVGSNATLKFMNQREGEPLVYVQSWDTLRCSDANKDIVIRMLNSEKTISVSCETALK